MDLNSICKFELRKSRAGVPLQGLSRQQGSSLFFFAIFVLPLLAFLISLGLDIALYLADQHKTQIVIDEAARYGYHFLPYQEEARAAVNSYLQRFTSTRSGLSVEIGRDSISVKARRSNTFTFAQLLSRLVGEEIDVALPFAVSSVVRGTPIDAFIAVDSSSYLAPDVRFGPAWGGIGEWPAASLFENRLEVSLDDKKMDPRLLTQQCFNPAFSAIKQAAIYTYDYLTSFGLNAVGLGFYPGSGVVMDLARPVTPVLLDSSVVDQVQFPLYQHPLSSSEYCAAAAENETVFPQYRFPQRSNRLPSVQANEKGRPVYLIDPSSWRLNDDYLQFLRVQEVVWARAAHQDQRGDFAALLGEIWSQLAGANYLEQRGTLAADTRRLGIIISGDLPWAADYRFSTEQGEGLIGAAISKLARDAADLKSNLTLWFLVVRHSGYPGLDCENELAHFRSFVAQEEVIGIEGSLRFEVFGCVDPPQLLSVVADLIMKERVSLVAR